MSHFLYQEELPQTSQSASSVDSNSSVLVEVKSEESSDNLVRSSTDDFFPLPVEIRRTNSFPCIPGSEENSYAERGVDILRQDPTSELSKFDLKSFKSDEPLSTGKNIDDLDFNVLALAPPQLRKRVGTPSTPMNQSRTVSKTAAMSTFTLTHEPNLPCKPFHLVNTHFYVDEKELKSIVFTIDECLRKMAGVSFKFNEATCLWETKCSDLSNCDSCFMDVQMYTSTSTDKGKYIVEANRMQGDHDIFRKSYLCLRAAFVPETSDEYDAYRSSTLSLHDSYASALGYVPPVSDFSIENDAKLAIEPILKMAESDFVDAQVEASRMLYEFTRNEDLQKYWCDERCMCVLTLLASPDAPEMARHNIFMTLAELASKVDWQELIVESGALPVVMAAVTNGSYETAEMRCECARTLEYLSQSHMAHRIPHSVGKEDLRRWCDTVDGLVDERLKLHAVRARDALSHTLSMEYA